MPKNCSADVQAVIAHVDQVFTGNNQTAIDYIKNLFGLGSLSHLDDVAGARKLRFSIFWIFSLTTSCSSKQLVGLAKSATHNWAQFNLLQVLRCA